MITAHARASPARETSAGIFDYVSPTRLNTWLSCPLKFKLRYVDGVKEPTSPSLFLGKRVHDGLEFFYRHLQDGLLLSVADVSRHVVTAWDEAVGDEDIHFDSVDEATALRQQCIDLVSVYLDARDVNEGVPIAVETPLECRLVDLDTGSKLGIRLLGFVDLVLQTQDGYVIVDFKTAARSSAPMAITHEIQLSSYAYAFRQLFQSREHELQIRSLIKTKKPKSETHRYPARNAGHFRRLLAVIRAYLDDLDARRFVYRPSWVCSLCAYRDAQCRQWQG